MEIGTLKELNAQPGDTVEYVPLGGKSVIGHIEDGRHYQKHAVFPYTEDAAFRIVSRATPPVDLTAITTPFGLLDEATQEALRAHGGPWEVYTGANGWSERVGLGCANFTYRVKPGPKREAVTQDMGMASDGGIANFSHGHSKPVRVTFDRVDGQIDLSTYRVEAR